MKVPRPVGNAFRVFTETPASARNAIRVIAYATIFTTLLGGVLVYIVDRDDFDDLPDALWWALQTVTTVGYGDVTPQNTLGRIVGGVVLVYSVAGLSILTAAITTSFVEQARRRRGVVADHDWSALVERLDGVVGRLEAIERAASRNAATASDEARE